MAAMDSLTARSEPVSRSFLFGGLLWLLVLWLSIDTVRAYWRLRHIKGPKAAAWSKWWMLRRAMSGRTHLDMYEVNREYGPIARIGPNDLITSDPDLMRHMLGVRSLYTRANSYCAMRLDLRKDNVLSTRNTERHDDLRARMMPGYSGKDVDNLEQKIDESVLQLVELIDQRYVTHGRPFDLAQKSQFLTFDAVSSLAFGEPVGGLVSDSDKFEFIKTAQEMAPTLPLVAVLPWLVNLLTCSFMEPLLPSDKDPSGLGKLMGVVKKIVRERYGMGAKIQRDMLGSFVAHRVTMADAQSEILLLLASSDAAATAIRSTMLHILTTPRVLVRLRAELLAAQLPREGNAIISNVDATALPYLQAVVREGLRIHPPAAGLMAKEVPAGGDNFKDVFLPGGTRIGYSAWGVMRNRDVWGPDADEFRPDRWLEADGPRLEAMKSTVDLVFSGGKWQCLGKNVALMVINKVLVELFRRFDFDILDPERPWKSVCFGIFLQSDFWVRAYRVQAVLPADTPETSVTGEVNGEDVEGKGLEGRRISLVA